ncbi:MAG TPA: hypothetical protein VK590_13405, partial [Saprospiraceae bacterium]|nr:hypothetical protein [Saprospiraceae bacterium]
LSGLSSINEHPDDYDFFDLELNPDLCSIYKDGDMKAKLHKGLYAYFQPKEMSEDQMVAIKCRYGKPGDLHYVRETWTQNGLGYYRYRADWGQNEGPFIGPSVPETFKGKWKPSIHMPKEASRIWEEVISVRVERL